MPASAAVRRTLFLALAALAVLIPVRSAHAIVVVGPGGHKISIMPRAGSPASPLGPAGFARGSAGSVSYHGGPVMHVSHAYAIFWNGSGGTDLFDPNYKSVIGQFLTDVATDSLGGHSLRRNVYSTTDQYTDTTGSAAYDSTFEQSLTDTDPFPAGAGVGCSYTGDTVCLDDAQLQTELDAFLTAHGLPRGLTNMYYLFTPSHIGSCDGGNGCSNTAFCAYHSHAMSGASEFLYANIPYTAGDSGCDKGQRPNGATADAVLSAVSHEGKETMTDPVFSGWWDSNNGYETSDKCNFLFGSPTGPAGQQFNQTINGHDYLLQQDWSNKDYAASGEFDLGCRLSDQVPTASFTTGPPAASRVIQFASTSADVDGTVATQEWNFGDGDVSALVNPVHTFATGGAHTVSLTVTDDSGNQTTTSQSVVVSPPPAAAFATPASTPSGSAVAFSAAGSAGDAPLTYSWSFGDGGTATGASASHAFARGGTATVTLTVRDPSGRTAAVSHAVTITNRKPTGSFKVSGGTHHPGDSVRFTAGGSKDVDGHVAKYSWRFGDGTTATGQNPKHAFKKTGTFRVQLIVTDDQGATSSSVTHSVTVKAKPKPKKKKHRKKKH